MQRVLASVERAASRCGAPPVAGLLALIALGACAPSAPARAPDPSAPALQEPEPAPAPAPEAASEPASAAEAAPSGDDGLDADIAELAASTRAGAAAALEPKPEASEGTSEPRGRDVVYRVTPKGLVIEIDGFHLRPEAKPFRDKGGAYGVELGVRAESFDGRQFWVNMPEEGPLSIAGKIQARDGAVQRFVDERVGSGEEVVSSEAPRTFKQRWPGRGQPKLREGQTLTLEVGLWGVRAESERERPVRRLFTVKMVAGKRSPAVIEPPALDWGS